jgi:YesN/AraC family two-component response regulator
MLKKLECLSGNCPWQLADRFAQTVDLASSLLRVEAESEQDLASYCPCMEDERVFQNPPVSPYVDSSFQNNEELSGRVKSRLTSLLCELTELKRGEDSIEEMSDAARILAIIDEHYLEELTLEKLALYCRMSESKIKKEFHSIYDGGVMKYICRLKMRDAAAMIEKGMSADKICEVLSIHDKNYFSFVFRREIGMTPSEYRRTHS